MKRALDHKTMFAWQPTSFGRMRKVPATEAERWRELDRFAVYPRRRARGDDWTHEEVSHLVTLLDQGYDYDACARKLGRTRTAIQIKVKRMRCAMSKRPAVLTARAVAQLLGKGCAKSVARWIARGVLNGHFAGRFWRVCWDDLMGFLHDECFWPLWDAARITDGDLRAEMLVLRMHEGAYLTQRDIAARYHVGVEAVGQWLDKGWLPFVHSGGGKGNRMVRERDLVGWVLPCERSKVGIPRRMGRRVEGSAAIVAYERSAHATVLARMPLAEQSGFAFDEEAA